MRDAIEINRPEMLAEIYRLRADVWSHEPGVSPEAFPNGLWTDTHDAHARHWAILDAGRVVAAARICVHEDIADVPHADVYALVPRGTPGRIASMNRLIIHQDVRGLGLSAALDQARLRAARAEGCHTVVAYARTERVRALTCLGFVVHGPVGALGELHPAQATAGPWFTMSLTM